MLDSQLKCIYESHYDEKILAICVNSDCKQPKLCCFNCQNQKNHEYHRQDIIKIEEFYKWQQDGVKIIEYINSIICEQEKFISYLKQLVLENEKPINIEREGATATQIEQQINLINKLRMIDYQIKTDLNQLSQQIKKILKDLKQLIGQQTIQYPTTNHIRKQEITFIQQQIMPAIQQNKFRFETSHQIQGIEISNEGQIVKGGINGIFFLCEPMLRRNHLSTFTIKYIGGIVYIGVCMKNAINKVNSRFGLQNQSHGYYLISEKGCTFSHHQLQMNNKQQQSFIFQKNEVIIVKVDLIKQRITWINQQTNQTLTIELDKAEQEYNPCVYLELYGKASIIDNF